MSCLTMEDKADTTWGGIHKGARTEIIGWLPASKAPDADITVLVKLTDGAVELGFLDGEDWRLCESGGIPSSPVAWWCDLPLGPV